MSKFKVGDTVRRTGGRGYKVVQGGLYVVSAVGLSGLDLEGIPRESENLYNYDSGNFELVQAAPTEAKYLTPQQTLENLLTDVPTQAMHCGEWLDINELDNVSVNFLRSMKCRTKPSTVRVGEYEVVKPRKGCNVDPDEYLYTFCAGGGNVNVVLPHELQQGAIFWDTREDAYAALQAIKKTLLGETK